MARIIDVRQLTKNETERHHRLPPHEPWTHLDGPKSSIQQQHTRVDVQIRPSNVVLDMHFWVHGCAYHHKMVARLGAFKHSSVHHQHHDLYGSRFGSSRGSEPVLRSIYRITDLHYCSDNMCPLDVATIDLGPLLPLS